MGRIKDLSGKKFGMLTVLCDSGKRIGRSVVWHCQCDCGNYKDAVGYDLERGNITSCGCKKEHDLSGERFGRLVVIKRDHKDKNNNWYWLCQCDCGKTPIFQGGALTSGRVKSCGCLKNEKFTERVTTHGMTNTRIYKIWSGMKGRCYTPSSGGYNNYGGRGIKVCDEWIGENGFINFYNWSMKNGYNDNLTIDRIDVNGNYEPSNCRWTDNHTQQNNRRDCVYINILGKNYTIAEWSNIVDIPTTTIARRIKDGITGIDIFRPHVTKEHKDQNKVFVYIANKKVYLNDTIYFLNDKLEKIFAKLIGVNSQNQLLLKINEDEIYYNIESIVYIYKINNKNVTGRKSNDSVE